MLHPGIFFTFFSAPIANVFTKMAKLRGHFAVQAHYLRSCIANSRTFEIKLNTPCHHFYIFFMETG
ncbi:MAG: hypothetical protein BGO55_03015 [Sphingobacteriales bacterium 50-39]|nr:MAG: hypothetical protein BGO55_03015 [Sphingobacteriales bacterium 50-39]